MIVHVAKYPTEVKPGEMLTKDFDEALEILRKECGEKRLIVHEGTYYACKIMLSKEDSGLIIEAAGGEKPVLSGAVTVNEWQVDNKTGWFVASAPIIGGKAVDFRLLLTVDGRYLKKARYPLYGDLKHESVFSAAEWVGSHAGGWQRELLDDELNHFTYKPEDIPEDFDDVSAEIQVYHLWNESYCKILKHDREKRTFWLTPNCTYPPGVWKRSYAIYNTYEGMGESGRWYCNRRENKIYYHPFPGESVENFACFVPVNTRIVELGEGCENITIRGLTLTAATTPVVNEQYQHPCQRGGAGFGVMEQDGAIQGEKLRNIEITDVEIYNTGGYGVMLRGESLVVRQCHIHHCGAGGIGISSTNLITDKTYENRSSSCVEECKIEHTGLDYYGSAGIFSDNAIIRRNHVAETPYSNIIANGDYCIVENNICMNPVLKLDDGGSIYLHINKGCIVRGNYCCNQNQPREDSIGIWGIFLDSDTTDYEIYDNVIRGFKSPMRDARRGDTNYWHHNYMEYLGDLEGDKTMILHFPEDKKIKFDNNILRCEKLQIIANDSYFNHRTDMNFNTFVCKQVEINDYILEGAVEPSEFSNANLVGANIKVNFEKKENGHEF